MFKKGFNTYKLGNLTVNIFTHDVVFIFIGRKGTYIRNIYKKDIVRYSRLFAMSLVVVLVSSLIFAVIPSSEASAGGIPGGENYEISGNGAENEADENVKVYSTNDINNILEDEKLKNDLLL